jgi:hypothetical protein
MAKGADSKNLIFAKLKEVYPNSFFEDEGKILRIPMVESGEVVEIKVTLTAAKTNLGSGITTSAFPEAPSSLTPSKPAAEPAENFMNAPLEPSEDEKNNVARLIAALNL